MTRRLLTVGLVATSAPALFFLGRASTTTPVAVTPKPTIKAVAAPEPRPESAAEKEARAFRKLALENRERLLYNTAEHYFYKAQQLTEDGTLGMARLLEARVENMRRLRATDPESGHALTADEVAELSDRMNRIYREIGRSPRGD